MADLWVLVALRIRGVQVRMYQNVSQSPGFTWDFRQRPKKAPRLEWYPCWVVSAIIYTRTHFFGVGQPSFDISEPLWEVRMNS